MPGGAGEAIRSEPRLPRDCAARPARTERLLSREPPNALLLTRRTSGILRSEDTQMRKTREKAAEEPVLPAASEAGSEVVRGEATETERGRDCSVMASALAELRRQVDAASASLAVIEA